MFDSPRVSVNSFPFRIYNLAADCVTQFVTKLVESIPYRIWVVCCCRLLAGGIIKIYVEVGLGSDRIGSDSLDAFD